jgi:signal transduction histidine kinase/DNA-binding LacI/PurR family transcriptional regulator/CheY-like chemotaxis protein
MTARAPSELKPEEDRHLKRPTFGFIGNWGFTNPYSGPMWLGAVEAAAELDVNLVNFGDINIYYPQQNRSLYTLIQPRRLDGLILVNPTFNQPDRNFFNSVPIVNVGCAGKDFVTSILVDNYDGMRTVVRHLVEIHGCKRLAFIKGPANNPDAGLRFKAYEDEIKAHGLALDANLLFQPFDWSPPGGSEGVRILLDERKVGFDGLVASNDNMALAAMQELQSRGIRVPYDVSVSGFDDAFDALTSTPPLTTVRQPLQQMGRLALEALAAYHGQKSVPQVFTLPVTLMVRRSCGCQSEAVLQVNEGLQADEVRTRINLDKSVPEPGILLETRREIILDEMQRALGMEEAPVVSLAFTDWLDTLIRDLEKGENGEAFLTEIDLSSRSLMEKDISVTGLQNVLSALRRECCRALDSQPVLLGKAENIWHRARVFLNDLVMQQQKQNQIRLNNRMAVVRSISEAMAVTFHLDNLMDILVRGLKQLGIQSCFVALFEDGDRPATQAHVILAYRDGKRLKIREKRDAEVFPSEELLPVQLWGTRRRILLLEALEFQEEEIGYILFEAGPPEGVIYEAVSSQLGSSVKGALLFDERDQLLTKTTQLYELAAEGQRLAEEANRLKSRFLSMVSHELRTPLHVISGLSELILWDANSEKPVNHENLERLHVTSQHLDGLIRDVLDLARDEMGELKLVREPLDMARILEAVVLVGEQLARERGLEWQAQIPTDLPLVWGDRTRLRQVVLNLINNAIKFTEKGSVTLKVTCADEHITLAVIDTGLGIPPGELDVIFDEFRQSDRTAARGFGGLGLGLAICKRLVEMHGGKIKANSSGVEGEGATFSFTLPTMQAKSLVGKANVAVWIITAKPENAGQLRNYLAEQGFKAEIQYWDSSDRWLERVTQSPPEAIVLDVHETPERGWEAIRALKVHPSTVDTTVLFYVLDAERNSGTMLELDYLTKPIGAPELAQALWRVGWAENDAAAGGAIPSDKTILIVDDDPGVLDMHSQIVRSQFPQYQILLAANGKEALLMLQTAKPDLILLDLMMPEMDGFGVLEEMKKMESACNIPVIVLSARILGNEEMARLNRSVAAVLHKGVFTADETLAHIKDALAHRQKLNTEAQRLTRKAMAYIHEHYSEPIGREDFACHVGVSEGYLSRSFNQETGLSLIHYLTRYRIQQAKQLLASTDKTITEIAMEVGFSDSNYFSRVFHQETGISPLTFRRKN